MPRRQKPPGMENWTWDEIDLGRKMSKSEKRYRRMAVDIGAAKDHRGEITPPSFGESPAYYWIFGGLGAAMVIAFIAVVVNQTNR